MFDLLIIQGHPTCTSVWFTNNTGATLREVPLYSVQALVLMTASFNSIRVLEIETRSFNFQCTWTEVKEHYCILVFWGTVWLFTVEMKAANSVPQKEWLYAS